MASKQNPSFDPKSFLAKVGDGRSIGKYRKDQIVFSQGDPADAVFYIQEGKVKVAVVSEQGKEAVVAILGPDDFFGEGCLAGQPRRMATVSAMPNGLFMRLEKASVVRVIHDEPASLRKCRRGKQRRRQDDESYLHDLHDIPPLRRRGNAEPVGWIAHTGVITIATCGSNVARVVLP
jgi:CRP-like cAMP-binding protein